MESIATKVPDYKTLLSLPTQEAAFLLLEGLQPLVGSANNNFNCRNEVSAWTYGFNQNSSEHELLSSAFMEAWSWLERHGILVHTIQASGDGWYSISREGLQLKARTNLSKFVHGALLPRDSLVAELSNVHTNFLIGDYDTAVFQAFKAVEVAVRLVGGFTDADIGVTLMRKAFNPDSGPLTDTNLVQGERQAMMDLFAGAVGYQKNPHSHRYVGLADPAEAAELVLLANHLLRIVKFRASKKGPPASKGPMPPVTAGSF